MLCLVIEWQRSKIVMVLLSDEFCPPFFIKVPAVYLWLRSVLILFKVFPCKRERNDLSTGASFISQIPFRLPLWLHVNHLDIQYLISPFFLIERIWFPLYLAIYTMNFSGQWITLFWWYLTPTHLIFVSQRKTDWGKTWRWTLFRWRV